MDRRDYLRAQRRRGRRRLAVLVAGLCVAASAFGTFLALRDSPVSGVTSSTSTSLASTTTSLRIPPASSTSTVTTAAPTTTSTYYVHAITPPTRIVIPAIEVDSSIMEVGLLDNGRMEVPPFGLAGWYKLGPTPGAAGPAVVVAHVDSTKGPDVFYRLKDLQPGDEILIYGESGDVATFVMDSKEQQLKTDLPVERIWNDTWQPVIRLITCGGEFDRDSRHYLSNVIVYGHLIE